MGERLPAFELGIISNNFAAFLLVASPAEPYASEMSTNVEGRGYFATNATPITVEIVRPREGQKGFAVQPRRWVIERTFGWISRCRRLARDHEATPSSALAFFVLAAAMILVRRLARGL